MPGDEELVRGEWRPLRGPSGPLTAGETSPVLTDLGWVKEAVIRLDITEITTPDGDDEVDWYIQTSYNGGVDWADLENVHVATAENGTTEIHLIVIGRPDTTTTSRPETDAGLADDTKLDLPIGDRIRIRTVVTGTTAPTYAYNAEIFIRG